IGLKAPLQVKLADTSMRGEVRQRFLMKALLARRSRLTLAALTIVLLIMPFSAVYLFYVLSQRSFYATRDFRVLENMGNHISATIDNLSGTLKNSASKAQYEIYRQQLSGGRDATQGGTSGKNNKPGCGNEQDCLKKSIEQVNRYGYNLKIDTSRPQTKQPAAQANQQNSNAAPKPKPEPAPVTPTTRTHAKSKPTKGAEETPQAAGQEPKVRMSVKEEAGAYLLRLDYLSDDKHPIQFSTTSDIGKLLDPVVNRYLLNDASSNDQVFDEVIVADSSDGQVIYERGRSSATLVNLNTLGSEPKLTERSSAMIETELAGNRFKLFLQPIQLPLTSAGSERGARWVICGLVAADRFQELSFSVSYNYVVTFAALLAAVLLVLPMIKLALMGPKDRLLRSNVFSVAASAVL